MKEYVFSFFDPEGCKLFSLHLTAPNVSAAAQQLCELCRRAAAGEGQWMLSSSF